MRRFIGLHIHRTCECHAFPRTSVSFFAIFSFVNVV